MVDEYDNDSHFLSTYYVPDMELSTLHALFNHHNLQNPHRETLAEKHDIIYSTHTANKDRSRIQTKASF